MESAHEEVLAFIKARKVMGNGLGYVDVHLLAAVLLTGVSLWTFDKKLDKAAEELHCKYGQKTTYTYMVHYRPYPAHEEWINARLFFANKMHRVLTMGFCAPFSHITEISSSVRARTNLTILLIHHLHARTLPAHLDTLVPTYLDRISEDPFDNTPLKYSLAQKLIYRTGYNHKSLSRDTDKHLLVCINFP